MSKMTATKPPTTTSSVTDITPEERSNVQFPWRLHELLTEAETNGNDVIISWLPDTNAFKVHNKLRFTTEILPAYFNATKYKSFQRNLNLWGFETITEGPQKGGCFHPLFVKGDRDKCHYMTRQKVKGNKPKSDTPSEGPPKTVDEVDDAKKGSLSTLANLASRAPSVQASLVKPSQDLKNLSFPKKLHHILARPEYEECVRWSTDGRCIRVVDPFRFQERVSSAYFSHTSFSSFLVELESYGFKKVTHTGFQECYYHDLMMRGCTHLCKYMANPQESRRFVSEDPQKDLEVDPLFSSSANAAAPLANASLTSNMSHLTSALPGQQAAEALLQQIHQQRQQFSGIGPLVQLLGGGATDPNLSGLQLGSLNSSLLGGGRRTSLPSYPLTASESSRSAITSFLANSQLSGDGLLRGAGNGINMRNP